MYAFDFHRPKSLEEALKLLGQGEDATPLAGGQTLLKSLRQRLAQPSDLVDLGAIPELHGVRREADALVIGATTRHAEVAAASAVRDTVPALAELASGIGDAQVRNMGTLGGSVANSDPAADYPAGVLGLGATVATTQREIAADDFFVDRFETVLEAGELIREIRFPIPQRAGYAKFPQPASRYALVGVMVAQTLTASASRSPAPAPVSSACRPWSRPWRRTSAPTLSTASPSIPTASTRTSTAPPPIAPTSFRSWPSARPPRLPRALGPGSTCVRRNRRPWRNHKGTQGTKVHKAERGAAVLLPWCTFVSFVCSWLIGALIREKAGE